MGIVNYTYNRSTSGGEIITHLINSTDGAGLHFDGAAGSIDIASPPDLGTKASFEFIIQADSYSLTGNTRIIDFGNGGRFIIGWDSTASNNLQIYSVAGWNSLGVKVLDDLKVHHLVVTVDGTAAVLYDNGNQVGTATITSPNIDSCADARIGSEYNSASNFFNGNIFRTRFWNKTLTQANITELYENAALPFADQWGSQTALITGQNSNFDVGLGDWVTGNNWNSQTNPASNMVLSATATNQRCVLDQSVIGLVAGKRYRFTYDASAITGEVTLRGWDGDYLAFGTLVAGTAQTIEFVATGITVGSLYIGAVASGAAITLDNLLLVEIGCVADYDLAFANPAISTTVQNRNDTISADGTASSGVTQITKIEQLNSKSARIGTSAATPADGELLVSGKVGVGESPGATLSVLGDNAAGMFSAGVGTRTIGGANSFALAPTGDITVSGNESGFIGSCASATVSGNRSIVVGLDNGLAIGTVSAGGVLAVMGGNVGIGVSPVNNLSVLTTGDAADDAAQSTFALMLQKSDDTDGLEIGIGFRASTALAAAKVPGGAITFERTGSKSIGSLKFKTAGAEDNLDTRLTISSAGDVTFATGNIKSGVDVNIYADDVKTLEMWNSGGVPQTKVHGTFRAEALGTFVAGVVDSTGPLKSNLLTNSGFDVWSNSTLENVGSDLSTNGTFASDTGWTKQTGWTIAGGKAVATGVLVNQSIYQAVTLTAGKLYKIVFEISGYSAGGVFLHDLVGNTTPVYASNGTHTYVFEANAASNWINFRASATTTLDIEYVTLYEVTPGCVAADAKAMDGWWKDGLVKCWRQHNDGGTLTHDGSFYGAQVYFPAANYELAQPGDEYNKAEWTQRFAGRTMTFGCWMKSSNATIVRISSDGASPTYTDVVHSDSGNWQWLEVTRAVSATATYFSVRFRSVATETVYISSPILVFGSAIGSGNYSRPMGEIVWCEKAFSSNSLYANGFSDVADTTMNLEADTNGKFPKGAKAFMFAGEIRDSASSTADGYLFFRRDTSGYVAAWVSPAGLANNEYGRANGTSPCDANGDYSYKIEASGSATTDVYLNYSGVQLR